MSTVEIPLTQGKFATIDEKDLEIISRCSWHYIAKGGLEYAETVIERRPVSMHRLIMNPEKGLEIDHRDSNGLNNTRSNLRPCTRRQNMMNRRKLKIGSSRFKGVSHSKNRSKWKAFIRIHKRTIYLGTHETEIGAAQAYDAAARELFGEFARTNFEESLLAVV